MTFRIVRAVRSPLGPRTGSSAAPLMAARAAISSSFRGSHPYASASRFSSGSSGSSDSTAKPHYEGTPASLAHHTKSDLGDALNLNLETVPLSFDKHTPTAAAADAKSPLIILHGLFGSKTNTRTVAKQLADRLALDVYCLDLRNFGASGHSSRLDYPSLAADVEKFILDQKFAHKPILCGHSMGAKTVMAIALRRPELPKMVIPVDNAPVSVPYSSGSSFSRYIRQLRIATEQFKYTNIKDVDAKLAEVEPNLVIRQFLLTNFNRGKKQDPVTSKIPLETIGKAIDAGNIASWPYDANISRWVEGPALFIRGTESTYVPDDVIPEIGKFFPQFEVRDIKSGHWVISEKPDDFMDVVTEFIERKEEDDDNDDWLTKK